MSANKKSITVIKLILCILILFSLPGCLGASEINDLEIVIGIAVDKGDEPESIILTAQIVKPAEMGKSSSGDSSGGGRNAYWNVSHTGVSVLDAGRQITHKTGNRLFLSHNQIIIFGNEIAKESVQKYIDFFLRANTMRPNTLVLVAEGRASDILDVRTETEKLPAINIEKLVKNYGFISQSYIINLNDFAERLLSSTTSPIAPLIKVTSADNSKDDYVSGMAVFKKGKMAGKLSQDETRGLLWVLGKVKKAILNIPSPNGQGKVVFEIVEAKSEVIPIISGGKISYNIKVKVNSILSEQSTTENLGTIQVLENLQKSQAEAIKQEIMEAWNKSKELDSDIFGFGDMLHKKYRKEWQGLEDKWYDIYPTLELNIDVQVKIIGTDLLTRPATANKGG
jgi:germination protein, Ger(x)C family